MPAKLRNVDPKVLIPEGLIISKLHNFMIKKKKDNNKDYFSGRITDYLNRDILRRLIGFICSPHFPQK